MILLNERNSLKELNEDDLQVEVLAKGLAEALSFKTILSISGT